ncbi:MAG: hypothetical protein AAGA96_09020 [Verrucomicrobiota bacterium]
MRSSVWILTAFLPVSLVANDPAPSEFHAFKDKRDQQIDARILSISEDRRQLTIERRDGNVFRIAPTVLSLDDQQFIKDWLDPDEPLQKGRVRGYGRLPGDKPLDLSRVEPYNDIVDIYCHKDGWLALRQNGELIASRDNMQGHTDVKQVFVNTVWFSVARNDGTVWGRLPNQHLADRLGRVEKITAGAGNHAVLLPNGEVKVWGKRYGEENEALRDPPSELPRIVEIASNLHSIAAVDEDGAVHLWSSGSDEVKTSRLGDGVVDVEGGVFAFTALTHSGNVYSWSQQNLEKATIPRELTLDGPYLKIHSSGATRAAQKKDGSWIAWGKNANGIIDQIKQLGPVHDIAFFSEPNNKNEGYLLWLEVEEEPSEP